MARYDIELALSDKTGPGAAAVDRQLRRVERSTKQTSSSIEAMGRTVRSAVGLLGAGGLAGSAVLLVRSLVDAQRETDRITRSLAFASGSAQRGAEQFDFLLDRTRAMGAEFATSARGFSLFLAATKDIALTRSVWEGATKASIALGLSQQDTNAVMLAFTQIASKGRVAAEELRGQIGERLPGAYELAARSVGMTTQEFTKQLETGKILASDLLPKIGRALQEEFGPAAQAAAGDVNAQLNRMQTELFLVRTEMASGFVDDFSAALGSLTGKLSDGSTQARRFGETLGTITSSLVQSTVSIADFLRRYDEWSQRNLENPADVAAEAVDKLANSLGGISKLRVETPFSREMLSEATKALSEAISSMQSAGATWSEIQAEVGDEALKILDAYERVGDGVPPIVFSIVAGLEDAARSEEEVVAAAAKLPPKIALSDAEVKKLQASAERLMNEFGRTEVEELQAKLREAQELFRRGFIDEAQLERVSFAINAQAAALEAVGQEIVDARREIDRMLSSLREEAELHLEVANGVEEGSAAWIAASQALDEFRARQVLGAKATDQQVQEYLRLKAAIEGVAAAAQNAVIAPIQALPGAEELASLFGAAMANETAAALEEAVLSSAEANRKIWEAEEKHKDQINKDMIAAFQQAANVLELAGNSTAGQIIAGALAIAAAARQLAAAGTGAGRAQAAGALAGAASGLLTGVFGSGQQGVSPFGGLGEGHHGQEGQGAGTAIGAVIGAGIASAWTFGAGAGAGAAIGGAIGGVIGQLVGSFIKKGAEEAVGWIKRDESGDLRIAVEHIEGGLQDAFEQLTGGFIEALSDLERLLGGEILGMVDVGFKIRGDTISVWVNNIEGQFKTMEDAINFALLEVVKTADFAGLSPEVASALEANTIRSAEQFNRVIGLAKHFEGLRLNLSPAEQAIQELMSLFSQAKQLGIAAEAGLGAGLQRIRDQIVGIQKSEYERRLDDAEAFNREIERLRSKAEAELTLLLEATEEAEAQAARLAEVAGQMGEAAGQMAESGLAAGANIFSAADMAARGVDDMRSRIAELQALLTALPAPIAPGEVRRPGGAGGRRQRREAALAELDEIRAPLLELGPLAQFAADTAERIEALRIEMQRLGMDASELDGLLRRLVDREVADFRDVLDQIIDPASAGVDSIRSLREQFEDVQAAIDATGAGLIDLSVRFERALEILREQAVQATFQDLGGLTVQLLRAAGRTEEAAQLEWDLAIASHQLALAEFQMRIDALALEGAAVEELQRLLDIARGALQDVIDAGPQFADAVEDAAGAFAGAIGSVLPNVPASLGSLMDAFEQLFGGGDSRNPLQQIIDRFNEATASIREQVAELWTTLTSLGLSPQLIAERIFGPLADAFPEIFEGVDWSGIQSLGDLMGVLDDVLSGGQLQALTEAFEALMEPIRDLKAEILGVGGGSGLGARLGVLQADLQTVFGEILGGSVEALQRFPELARRAIEAAGEFGGAGVQAALREQILAMIGKIEGATVDEHGNIVFPGSATSPLQVQEESLGVQSDMLTVLREILEEVRLGRGGLAREVA